MWWVVHLLVICSMAVFGYYLGVWLVAILQEPASTDMESGWWWQVFQKFAATVIGGIFAGVFIGYILLIRPQR